VCLSLLFDLPTPFRDEPGPKGWALEGSDLRIPGEMLCQERRPEVMEDRLRGSLQSSGSDAVIHPVVGGLSAPSMDHGLVSLFSEPLAKSSDLAA